MAKKLVLFLLVSSSMGLAQVYNTGTGGAGETGATSGYGSDNQLNTNTSTSPYSQQSAPLNLPNTPVNTGNTLPDLTQECLADDEMVTGAAAGNPAASSALQNCLAEAQSQGATGTSGNRTTLNYLALKAALRPVVHSDFEKFVADAAGTYLPVYGRNLFNGAASTFAPLDRIPVPSNYVIGPGDQLLLRLWGMVNFQGQLVVDRNGQISIPKVGVLDVAGLQYSQLDQFLRTAISRIYKGFELNVTMGRLRSIQIFVLGHATQPGMYTISSLSTLVNALFVSGGPSSTGSMRSIQLRRGNQVVTEFDLYDLQQRGDRSHDVQLLPGDVIYIPPVGKQIALIGNVNQPGIYELKGNTTVGDAIRGAGGLTNVAATGLAVLERIEERRRRLVDQFALDKENLGRQLQDGDILRVFPISPKFEDTVTLHGTVETPGRYSWHAGMRVSDLIPNREFLIPREHWQEQNDLTNNQIDRLKLTPRNQQLQMLPGQMLLPGQMQSRIPGQQQQLNQNQLNPQQLNPQQFNQNQMNENSFNPNQLNQTQQQQMYGEQQQSYNQNRQQMPEQQLQWNQSAPFNFLTGIEQNSAEINWDYAAIERLDLHDLSTQVIPFNLGKAIDDPTSADNRELQPGDVITVFGRKDLTLPVEKRAMYARISGEVNAPGIYRVRLGETLRELIEQAGGLTKDANVYGTILARESAKRLEQQQIDHSVMQMKRDLMSRVSTLQAVQDSGQAKAVSAQVSMEQSMIGQLSAIQPTGRVILGLKPSVRRLEDLPAFALEDGDTVVIPTRLNTIQIIGAVYNANAFRYDPHKSIEQYLRAAGGSTREADTAHTYLMHADGSIVTSHSHSLWSGTFGTTTLFPGDVIVVPIKVKIPGMFWQNFAPVMSALSQAATMGVIVATYLP